MMNNFDYMTPTRLIFGKDVVNQLPEVMGAIGKRVLLAYGGGSIKRMGLYDKVKELMKDFEVYELSGIEPNPRYNPSVLDGVRICKEKNIEVILAVGGGSVLDCTKAIAAGALYDGDPYRQGKRHQGTARRIRRHTRSDIRNAGGIQDVSYLGR